MIQNGCNTFDRATQKKGKSVAACLKSRTDYAKNPDKTNRGELVSSYECSPLTADEEFMLSKRQYELATGRRQKNDVIAYQIRQSFKPGEITAEEANKVGYELAMRFIKGKYAFIVATHTDREHIHNHIIYNFIRQGSQGLFCLLLSLYSEQHFRCFQVVWQSCFPVPA